MHVLFAQLLDDDLGCASYLVGDEDAGVAAIVDPPYAVEPLLRRSGAACGSSRRSRRTRTPTTSPGTAGWPSTTACRCTSIPRRGRLRPLPMDDGDEIALGSVTLRCVHTPGHRPEHCCWAVIDRTRAEEPWLVLTGDSLFVGDAARPDLAVEAREGAEGLFHSLHRLLELPDGVEVFPATWRARCAGSR